MKYKYISTIVIILIVLSISTMTIITPDKEHSLLEGRTLEIIPLPSFIRNIFIKEVKVSTNKDKESENHLNSNDKVEETKNCDEVQSGLDVYINQIINGEYFKRWETYFSDHLFARDQMVKGYMNIQENLKSKYINGVFIGQNKMFFSYSNYTYNNSYLIQQANKFNNFADELEKIDLYIGVVPDKIMCEQNTFPIKEYSQSQEKVVESFYKDFNNNIEPIKFNNLRSENNVFYKTDHHLNYRGAYLAYKDIIEKINDKYEDVGETLSEEEFNIEEYKECFMGSDGRKIGYVVDFLEDLKVYSPKNINYKAFDDGIEYDIIDRSQISKERYNNDGMIFMGGDKSRVVIENYDAANELDIVIVGDSVDNAIIPMLIPHFNKIYSFDLRYNNIDIKKEIDLIKPDIVLFLGLPFGYLDKESAVFRF